MCIIAYKSAEEKFPTKAILKTCFENNPDGAGFMYSYNHKVYIEKGLMSFTAFWKKLQEVRKKVGDNLPYVLHFRISTQAGKRADCTHPYPLTKSMEDLRKLSTDCEIGVAHNGIISLTSVGYSYTKQITYNDTMKFITDYLALIIKNKDYYEDKDTLDLIKRLCGSRLAILDGDGNCQLIGTGWEIDDGIVYSNSSYIPHVPKTQSKIKSIFDEKWDNIYCRDYEGEEGYGDCYHCNNYEWCYGEKKPTTSYEHETYYEFNENNCPVVEDDDWGYCPECKNFGKCIWTNEK